MQGLMSRVCCKCIPGVCVRANHAFNAHLSGVSAIRCVGIILFVSKQGLREPHQQTDRWWIPTLFVVRLTEAIIKNLNLGVIGKNFVTMKEPLRKVQFNLSDAKFKDFTIGDREFDENDVLKKRYGLFHCWGETIRCDSESGQKYQETVAIVEEIETGDVYKADPNTIVFIKENNNS